MMRESYWNLSTVLESDKGYVKADKDIRLKYASMMDDEDKAIFAELKEVFEPRLESIRFSDD